MRLQLDIKRNKQVFIICIVSVLVIMGYIVYTFMGSAEKTSMISGLQTQNAIDSVESELYSETLNIYNESNAETAIEKGETYLSVLSSTDQAIKSEIPESVQKESEIIKEAPPKIVYVPQYYPQPAVTKSYDREENNQLLVDQTFAILESWTSQPVHSTVRISEDHLPYVASLYPVDKDKESLSDSASDIDAIVDAYALVPAVLETEIDTDENSSVSAFIPVGKYKGARVFASGYKLLTNTVDMTFTAMEWEGESYEITAKPIDQKTMRSSLSGKVNNRWFTRILLPAIANGIGKTGQLYEQANSQNIISNGNVIQTYPSSPSGRAVGGTILGGIGQHAGKVLADDAARTPVKQVIVEKDTIIGIRFIGPVLKSDSSLNK